MGKCALGRKAGGVRLCAQLSPDASPLQVALKAPGSHFLHGGDLTSKHA